MLTVSKGHTANGALTARSYGTQSHYFRMSGLRTGTAAPARRDHYVGFEVAY